jgi:hypothetical protein
MHVDRELVVVEGIGHGAHSIGYRAPRRTRFHRRPITSSHARAEMERAFPPPDALLGAGPGREACAASRSGGRTSSRDPARVGGAG